MPFARIGPAIAATCACLALASCERPAPQPNDSTTAAVPSTTAPDTARWTVTPRGIGPIRTGITVAELSQALGRTITPVYDFEPTCTHVRPPGVPAGVLFMIISDTVARVEIISAGVLTADGVGVGDLEADVVARYGARAQVQPHKYTGPQGHYVVITEPGDSLHQIIFETDGQRVTIYRAGRVPAVQFVEGCA